MKKCRSMLLGVVLCLCLAGCSQLPPPENAADGAAWSKGWVTVGNVLGVDTPVGVDARENSGALADWQSMAASQYDVEETVDASYNGQPFTIMTYTYTSETNPYQRGASAFGIYRNYAVNVELSCQTDFGGDALALLLVTGVWYILFLSQFLIYGQMDEAFHIEERYGAQEGR